MEQTLDRLLARHCAPALLGVKPANLVSLPLEEYRLLAPQIAWYSHVLRQRGLRFLTLDRRCKAVLLLIYSPVKLKRHLEQESCRQMLSQVGYPSEGLSEKLLFLQSRLAENQDFPHEIGLFLGYPPQRCAGLSAKPGTMLQTVRLLEGVFWPVPCPAFVPPLRLLPGLSLFPSGPGRDHSPGS